MSAAEMVARDYAGPCRRVGGRRAYDHATALADRCGELFNRDDRVRVETLLVENQAAGDEMLERLAHLIAALQTACNEARHARAAGVASRRAGHLAAGAVSGVEA